MSPSLNELPRRDVELTEGPGPGHVAATGREQRTAAWGEQPTDREWGGRSIKENWDRGAVFRPGEDGCQQAKVYTARPPQNSDM